MKTVIVENNPKIHVGSRQYLAPDEILHLESDVNYTNIFLKNGQKILSSTTLKTIEHRLLMFQNFIRINRSIIINQDYLKPNESLHFTLSDERTITFSRRKAKAYLLKFN